MSGHTQGPWVVANPDHDELVIVAATGTDDAEDVAVLFAHPSTHPNAPANAALIAAAPDLLELAKRWLRLLDDSGSRCVCIALTGGREKCCRCSVDAAIAKAEGRQP